jgi:hypothetical protein
MSHDMVKNGYAVELGLCSGVRGNQIWFTSPDFLKLEIVKSFVITGIAYKAFGIESHISPLDTIG